MSECRLDDLLDLTIIQKMADAHYLAAGMPIGIIDAVDGSIIVGSGWQDICVKFHRVNPVSRLRCQESDNYIKDRLAPGEACHCKCKNGLWDIGLPIVVAGRHLASMFLGQFFYVGETPDREYFIQLAQELGFDVDEYLAALDRVPVFSREKVEYILEYDKALVSFIADLAEHALLKIKADRIAAESDRKFRAIFDQAYEFIGLFSIEGRLLEANKSASRFAGVEEADVLGRRFSETPWWAHSPELQKQVCLAVQKAAQGEFVRFEASHLSAAGDLHFVDFSVKPVMDEAGKVVLLISEGRDITESKRAQEAVRRSEAGLRSFVEMSPFGVFRTHIEEDRFLDVNPALVNMLGYSSAEEIFSTKLSADVYLHPRDREKVLAPLLRNGFFTGVEIQCKRRDGTTATVSLSGRLTQDSIAGGRVFEGIVEDVTQRKRAEQALRESEERFRQAVEGAPVGMYIQTDGIIRYLNPAALAIFGAESASRIVGRGFLEVIHPDTRPAVIGRARRVLEDKQSAPFLEERLLRLDGTVFDGEVTAVPFIFEGRSGALVFVRDITERKREEEKRHALEQQLLQAQKMEAVGRLAGGIAHDFNNLLMVMQSYTETLQDSLPAHSSLRKNTRAILKASERAANLTGQMLAFSRKQITSPVVLDLNAVIDDTATMLNRLLGEDIDLRVEMKESLWAVKADPDQIVQVLMNLCVNARDAMPQGGRLTIASGNVTVGEGGRPPYILPGNYVKISVTDTGIGISKDVQGDIFEPFFTTKEVGKGTGLGLAMVYGIVKQSGGHVWVDSDHGQGACFTIYLPMAEGVAAPNVGVTAESQPQGTETLLVVEDEEALREALCDYLLSLGYTVLAAGSGQQALAQAGEYEGRIDLLITDVVMPKMSGRELSQMLGSLRSDLRTIYMSGYTDDAVLRHGIHELGATFVKKPFRLITLARKIRDTLEPKAMM